MPIDRVQSRRPMDKHNPRAGGVPAHLLIAVPDRPASNCIRADSTWMATFYRARAPADSRPGLVQPVYLAAAGTAGTIIAAANAVRVDVVHCFSPVSDSERA
jgi:hypothetical protein